MHPGPVFTGDSPRGHQVAVAPHLPGSKAKDGGGGEGRGARVCSPDPDPGEQSLMDWVHVLASDSISSLSATVSPK